MGKSYSRKNRRYEDEAAEDTIFVPLDEIYISDATWNNLLKRDSAQIEEMRRDIEDGREMVRVVLRPRCGGGYNVEDGRHRVIAAKLAGAGFLEAKVVGS